MSVNKFEPHIFVLPEDDANSDLATGFHQQVDLARQRRMQVLPAAGGWQEVLNLFESDHERAMARFAHRLMVLLIDFDNNMDRLSHAKRKIPEHLTERVFVLGVLSDPEALKRNLGPYEKIGTEIAKDCREDTSRTLGHPLLKHNASELERLRQKVRAILFPPG